MTEFCFANLFLFAFDNRKGLFVLGVGIHLNISLTKRRSYGNRRKETNVLIWITILDHERKIRLRLYNRLWLLEITLYSMLQIFNPTAIFIYANKLLANSLFKNVN